MEVIAIVVAILLIWISARVHASRQPSARYEAVVRSKNLPVVRALLIGFLGGGYYRLVIRRELTRVARPA